MNIHSKKIVKKKDIKTKKKRMNVLNSLLTQTGGASNTKLLFSRDEFKNNFDIIFKNLVLYKHNRNVSFNTKNENITKHLTYKLNNLMTIKDSVNEIDLSFINEIYSFPYLDTAGYFALKKSKIDGKVNYEFVNKDKQYQIYEISKVISVGTGAGDILLLTKKQGLRGVDDYPEELVLKLYNKKPIIVEKKQKVYNKYNNADNKFIKDDKIKDYGYKDYTAYSSLKIFDISKKSGWSAQGNYYKMNFDTFTQNNQAFNLNSHNCLIENFNTTILSRGGDGNNSFQSAHSTLSKKSNRSINIQHIDYVKNVPTKSSELTEIQDKSYIYIASSYDDFINEYIQQFIMKTVLIKFDEKKKTKYKDNIMNFYNAMVIPVEENRTVNYYGCLIMEKVDGNMRDFLQLEEDKITDNIKINQLRKCITDINDVLKILKNPNNCFCHTDLKLENVFYKKLPNNKYKYILADYDKSSITFNKIRFYNNGFESKYFKSYDKTFIGYGYEIDKKSKTYKITRPRISKSSTLASKIEGEQFFLRYNPFPTILKFDINMFVISIYFNSLHIFSFLKDNAINKNANNTLKKNRTKLINLSNKFSNLDIEKIKQLRTQYSISIKSEYSKYNGNFGLLLFYSTIINTEAYKYDYKLNNFYVSNSINLSCLSNNKKLIISNGLSNIEPVIGSFSTTGQSKTAIDKDKKVSVLFTGNTKLANKGILGTDYTYFKTNRYSNKGLLYEWDYCNSLKDEKNYSRFWELVKVSID